MFEAIIKGIPSFCLQLVQNSLLYQRFLCTMDNKQTTKNTSSWKKRTKLEKGLIAVLALCVISITFLAISLFLKKGSLVKKQASNVCLTQECITTSASIIKSLDPSVNPCDDFYQFACGNFLKTEQIPDEDMAISPFYVVNRQVTSQMRAILEEPVKEGEPNYSKYLKTIYTTCMNTTRIEEIGLSRITRIFKEMGGWPVTDPLWTDKNFEWVKMIFRLRKLGLHYNLFFSLYIGVDQVDSKKRVITISQPCSNYKTLKKGLNETVVQAYYEYMINIATAFGVNKTRAEREMREVVDFEINFAKIIVPWEERQNLTLSHNPMTIRQLQREFSTIPWLQYINVMLAPYETVGLDETVIVTVPKFITKMEDMLFKTKKKILANVMFWKVLRTLVSYLPESLQNEQDKYLKKAYGKGQRSARWKDCVWQATSLNAAMSSIYVKHNFNDKSKTKVVELVDDIKASFVDTLKHLTWMDGKTKRHALAKAERMGVHLAYPEELNNKTLLTDYYNDLHMTTGDYLELGMNLSLFDTKKMIQELREPVVDGDWKSHSYSYFVNAFYSVNENDFELPAAILQDIFYGADRPQYMNYGAIGYIIGHEITHGFDNRGRQYDKDGNLVDWWEPLTNQTFTKRAQCIVAQYSNVTVAAVGMNVNGTNTQGENIADNGGVKLAYRGYQRWVGRNGAEAALPGLQYTPKQLFWISAATIWCSKYKREALKEFVTSGVHSPNNFRVTIPFANSDYFARDFNCPLGAAMNPKYKCRVW